VLPALTPEHNAYLTQFAATRRMKRDPLIAVTLADPFRMAVGLPIGPDGAYFVGTANTIDSQFHDLSVTGGNQPPAGQPGLWCQWVPRADGTAIEWDEGEKFYEYATWIQYLMDHFLTPWGYSLAGVVYWQGEESSDQGRLVIDSPSNQVRMENPTVTWPTWPT